jgi:hypothetical protein
VRIEREINNNNNTIIIIIIITAGVFPTTGNIWGVTLPRTRVKPINMERQTLRSLGKQPLPGERQGTSRAGAGRDSGSRLTRRITAQKKSHSRHHNGQLTTTGPEYSLKCFDGMAGNNH